MDMVVICCKYRDKLHIVFQEFLSMLLDSVVHIHQRYHPIVLHSIGGGDTETYKGCQMHCHLFPGYIVCHNQQSVFVRNTL